MIAEQPSANRTTRRVVLQQGLACTLLPSAVLSGGFGDQAAAGRVAPSGRTLVLLHLWGGNDGLNTIIPHADPLYRQLRPSLGRVAQDAIDVDGQVGFHPALSGLARLYDAGHLAIVQGVGCPDPDYSHVGSCRIWATGSEDQEVTQGWWDDLCPTGMPATAGTFPSPVVCVGRPRALLVSPHLCRVAGGQAGASNDPGRYVPGEIRRTLAIVLGVLTSSTPPRLVLATAGGFDTHADQLPRHEHILHELGDGLAHFQRELTRRDLADHTLVMAWSEFGRRPAENAAGGTDHGSAGPVFLMGRGIQGGLYGTAPSLDQTDFGNLIASVDFRSVYHRLADNWLGQPLATT